MKIIFLLFLTLAVSCVNNDKSKKAINLLEGDNIDQWDFTLEDTLLSKSDIWHIKEGTLFCSGAVNGYIVTKKEYSNYRLSFDWRWPQEEGNSGVLLHISGPYNIWPLCIEAQLKAGNAGDFIMMGGSTISEQQDTTKRRVEKLNESNEKTAGEWNRYEITCRKDSITLSINGLLQNKASQASLQKGKIGLQSEGKPIEFRNIYIEQL